MYLVREYLGDSYVIDADVYLNRNFLERDIEKSTYFSGYKIGFENEWKLDYDENNKVSNIIVDDGEGYILSGISYWSKSDASIINKELEKYIENGKFKDLYWDNVVKANLDVYIRKIKSEDSFEVDSLEDLSNLNKLLNIIYNPFHYSKISIITESII